MDAVQLLERIARLQRGIWERERAELGTGGASPETVDLLEINALLAELDLLREREGGTARQVELAVVCERRACADVVAKWKNHEVSLADIAEAILRRGE